MCFLMPGGEKIPLAITSAITKHSVTTLHFVPSMLNVFLEYLEGKDEFQLNKLNSINKIFSSGETLAPSYVKKFNNIFKKNEIKLINLYGPTEAAVDVSYYECPRNNYFDKIPIGKPIDNTRFYIINAGELQGIGQTGELCISGICLARGYINNQELTESRFVDNPFLPGRKMYKTGDLARWLEDGNVEYLGREDHQVKIRGLRIELGEIESVIREYEDVKDCLVSVNRYSENITLIIAYVVCRPGLDLAKLKAYAGRYLPDYMMPSHFIEIEGIPLLSNGKADRKSLPEPVLSAAK